MKMRTRRNRPLSKRDVINVSLTCSALYSKEYLPTPHATHTSELVAPVAVEYHPVPHHAQSQLLSSRPVPYVPAQHAKHCKKKTGRQPDPSPAPEPGLDPGQPAQCTG